MIKPILLVLLLFFFLSNSFAQTTMDSLHKVVYNTSNDSIKGEAYLSMAQILSWREPETALAYLDTLSQIKMFETMPAWQAWSDYYIGDSYLTLEELEKGKDFASKAIIQFEKLKDTLGLASAYYQLGKKAYIENEWPTAIKQFLASKKMYEDLNHTQGIAAGLNGLGVAYSQAKMQSEALTTYQEAFDLYSQLDNKQGMAINLNNIGTIQIKLEQNEAAVESFNQVIKVLEGVQYSDRSKANARSNNSSALLKLERYDEAIENGTLAYEYYKELEMENSAGIALINVALANQKKENKNLAIQQFDEVFQLMSQDDHNPNLLSKAALQASELHKDFNNYKKAYEYLEMHNAYQDSILNKEVLAEINDLKTKYETEKKETEIERLGFKNELSQTKLTQRKYTIFGLLGGLLLLGGSFFQIFKQNGKIKNQNHIISNSLQEKETLLKEIHHRVKNNLQTISSLLGIQSRKIKDEKAKEAIQEGRNRVHSMALIHQNLYNKDNLAGIEMKDYLKKLGNNLFKTYNTSDANIKLITDVDPIKLDVETVVPIGLIINELMTNSLKYAFPDQQDGTISLSLKEMKDQLILSLADDGVGLNENSAKSDENSFGHSLIKAFKDKLNADISITSDTGTKVELIIRNYKTVSITDEKDS